MPMNSYFGIDTSNYTTSCARLTAGSGIEQKKLLLPVKPGDRGLRQSDALFHHIRQLPEVFDGLLSPGISAVGVSVRPRNTEGSYMPCFLAGKTVAEAISRALSVPLYETSHQVGHILAALYSARRLDLINTRFIAFHVSGGTTDCLLCEPDPEQIISCREIGTSLDLKAGQAVDRVGVMLGLGFPCGPALERLAGESDKVYRINPTLKGGDCCLSGIENKCRELYEKGAPKPDVALYCLKSVGAAITGMSLEAIKRFGELPLVYAGGVMSNKMIRTALEKRFGAIFSEPAFSSDNAAGVAVFAAIKGGEPLGGLYGK